MHEKIFDLVKDNLKNPRFYIVLLLLVFVLLLLFPYIDANIFYYDRVEKRVTILKEISEIDPEALKNDPILESEYQSILSEISKQKDGSIGSIFVTNSTQEVKDYKFLTGAALSWLIAILCIFIKMESPLHKIVGFMVFAVIGGALGYLAELIPTIIDPMCNYILIPVIELVIFCMLITSSPSSKAESS